MTFCQVVSCKVKLMLHLSPLILQLYFTLLQVTVIPRNVGSFKKNEENVGTGLVGAPACGDVMKLQVSVVSRVVSRVV